MTSFSQKVEQKLLDNVSIQESPFDIRTHSEREVRLPKPAKSDVVSNQGLEDEYNRPSSSVELIDKRTEFSRTMKNGDGTYSVTSSSIPIHYQEGNDWKLIEPGIFQEPFSGMVEFPYGNITNTFKTYFPSQSNEGFVANFGYNQTLKDGLNLKLYFENENGIIGVINSSANVSASLSNNVLTYNDIFDKVNLRLSVLNDRRKSDYIITDEQFLDLIPTGSKYLVLEETVVLPENCSFEYNESSGKLAIFNDQGKSFAQYDAPFVFDKGISNNMPSNNLEIQQFTSNAFFDVIPVSANSFKLKTKVSVEWLMSDNRIFPITVDPDLTGSISNQVWYAEGYAGHNPTNIVTSGAAAGSTITNVEYEIQSQWAGDDEFHYYNNSSWFGHTYCDLYFYFYLSNAAGSQITSCGSGGSGTNSGSSSAFNSLNPNETWTVTYSSPYPFRAYCSYGLTVTYTEPVAGQPPVADFSASTTAPYFNETVSFTDLSTNTPTGWAWAFNPNTVTYTSGTASSQSPTVRFDASGTYDVFLNAQNANGDDDEIKVGYITVSSDLIIPSTGSSSISTCSGNLYDSGGSSSNYAASSDGYITIYPGTVGQKVNITGSITMESGYDYFYVYDGENTSATDLTSGGASGSGVAVNYTSTHSTGALTIRLTSDGSIQYAGVDVAISCVTPCSGTPATPTASISQADYCAGTQGTISVSGYELGSGISYDWEYSTDGGSTWTSAGLGNTTIYATGDDYQWRYITTCSNSGASSTSNVVTKTLATITSGGDASECGSFTGNLSASTNVGNVEWYEASSGGTALSTGATYAPGNTSTTSYYAASSGCPGSRTAVTATVNANPTPTAAASVAGVCSGGTVDLTSTSSASIVYSLTTSGGSFLTEKWVNITTGVNGTGTVAWAQGNGTIGDGAGLLTAESIDLSAYAGQTLYLNAYDKYSDGWDGSIYTLSLDGVTVINNGGVSPSDASTVDASSGWDQTENEIEASESFTVSSGSSSFAWTSDVGGYTSSSQNPTSVSPTANTTYTVTETDGNSCTGTSTVAVLFYDDPVAGTVAVTDLSVSGNADLTEAIEADAITWTNSGTANGSIQYYYEWTNNSSSSPTGAWNAWETSNPNIWNANSSGSNMNRTLWVKTITTSSNGCGTAESNSTWIDVRNCRANTTTASVSAGTVANMPFGETITYTAGTPVDGSFEKLQFQWNGTSDGSWTDWSTDNPTNYTTDINAGQTLYVRAKIIGADAGSGGCIDYSNNIQTFLIDCPNTVSASAGSDVDLCNGSTVALSGSGSGSNVSSYAWSPNTEISSTSSATPTVSATNTRTYTLTNTHDNGCTSTDDIVVTVADGPSITTATDLTAAANTCGETELTISHSGTGGNGQWTYSGGLVSYNNSNTTDATINVTPQPSDVNTDITMTWTVGAGEVCDGAIATKTIRFNQPTSISSPDTYCYLWGGLTSADNATGSNWYKWDATKSMWARQSTAPSTSTDKLHVLTTDNNCIHATNAVTLGTTTIASLNVGSGATMNLGSGTVTLNGDLTNAGTINEGTGTVSLTAAGDQTLSGGGTTNFNNLTLNKTSDNLVLSSPATIKGTLTMNKGNINNGSNILTIGESSASPGAITHNSGSVTGKLRRYFANASSSSKYFPIGNASTTRDVTVSFGSTPGSNQFLTASYNAGYPQLSGADLYAGLPLTTADGQLIQNYDDEGYWEINPGSTATGTADSYSADINSAAYNLTIHMNGLTGANSASMDRTKVRIIKSAGPSHTSWVALTHGSISGSVDSDYTVSATGSGFSFFGAGTDDGNALPVELVSFNGACNEGVVDLVWQTASEQNSEDFEVAYSRDGVDWKTIHTEPAAGFSNALITYDYTHNGAVSGNNYYRLTQNDIDGASVVYDNLILNANCQTTSEGYFSVFPNPSSGTFQVIMNNENLKGAANINMLDTKGNVVFTKPIEVNSGINMYVIQKQLSPGIYYIHIDNGTMRTQVVKHSIR